MKEAKYIKGLRALLLISGLFYSAVSAAGGNLLQPKASGGHDSVIWQNSQIPIKWYLSEDGLPGAGISNQDLANILQTAFGAWQSISTSRVSFEYSGEYPERISGIDGKSLITFTDQDYVFQENELAFAITYTFTQNTIVDADNNDLDGDGVPDLPDGDYPAGAIYEADIVFNASYPYDITGAASTVDIQAVALHEIGHLFGLSHSIIPGAVMHPFLSADIDSARTLKADDIAYASYLYPDAVNYPAAFGLVAGTVTNGFGGQAVLGAHVFAVDPDTGKIIIGAYSLETGGFVIPGLEPGDYYIGIEPLDSDPLEADPKRINEVIKDTLDTNFVAEFYDANESNIETDPNNAQIVNVPAPGATVTGINIVTNTTDVPGVGVTLLPGINLFSYPVETSIGFTAFALLKLIGDPAEINSIDRYNPESGRYERALWSDGQPDGINFDIRRGEGYLIHMNVLKAVSFEGQQNCPLVDTVKGFNLIGVPCPPAGYKAYDLLRSIGPGVIAVQQYNHDTNAFEVASLDPGGEPVGNNFSIANGVGYVVETRTDRTGVSLPGLQQIFPPYITAISPGRAVIGTEVMVIGQGFSDDPTKNEVTFNGKRAAVKYASGNQLIVAVPSGATTGPVIATLAGKISNNNIVFVVEPALVNEADMQGKDLVDGQTVQGNLDNNDEQDRYSFIATKGALISATAIPVNPGSPDLWLYLEGPSGEVLAQDENSSDGASAKIYRFEAGRTGRYTLVVTARPGTGVGPYTLNHDIENTPPVAEIAILSGDFQTGLMGTQLPTPLEVLVTGPNGAPVAGAIVGIITDDADNITITNGFTAATKHYLTNSSGIVTVSMALPGAPGQYNIVIHIPGYDSKTIKAASVASLPVKVEVVSGGQDCGGNGCPVNQVLAAPYKLRYLDSSDQPVAGVLTKFAVVSGGGKLIAAQDVNELSRTSDASGEVAVIHRLGMRVYDTRTGLRIPQIVAATGTNPGTELWLFESRATAGAVSKFESLKTNSIRMTMGTAELNAIYIKVIDDFGNPVEGASIVVEANGGLAVEPGYDDNGDQLLDYSTNSQGEFYMSIIADYQSQRLQVLESNVPVVLPPVALILSPDGIFYTNYGLSGVKPTIDEFGVKIPETLPYEVIINIAGLASPLKVNVDVDMGPKLVIADDPIALAPYDGIMIGSKSSKPIYMTLLSFQRDDTCISDVPVSDMRTIDDDDSGLWTDEDFELHRIFKTAEDADFTATIKRTDGVVDSAGLQSPFDTRQIKSPPLKSIDLAVEPQYLFENEFIPTLTIPIYPTVGDAKGLYEIELTTNPDGPRYNLRSTQSIVCKYSPTQPVLFGTGQQGGWFDNPRPSYRNTFLVKSVAPKIEVIVTDQAQLQEPDLGVLQMLPDNSGIDLTKLSVRLNSAQVIFGGSGAMQMNQYPNYMQAEIDGAAVSYIDAFIKESFVPMQFKFVYYPTSNELNLTDENRVDVINIQDRSGNSGEDQSKIFTLP